MLSTPRIIVVGAGAFGGWTALALRRRGADVTLVDAWGPGNARASSGGRTRIIRATYGSHATYTKMAARAMTLWQAYDAERGSDLYRKTGALWIFGDDAGFADASVRAMRDAGLTFEPLETDEARARYPQFAFTGRERVMFEPESGFALARRACRHVVRRFVTEGGRYLVAAVAAPVTLAHDDTAGVRLATTGEVIEADVAVYACGPWLPALFPDVVGDAIRVTRQEVYYFGVPAGDARFAPGACPVWLDLDRRLMYGVPESGGFKVANDTPGSQMNPTTGDRTPSASGIADARAFVARRFPALADAPLVSAEVCQYESTPDANFIIDRHPRSKNVWIAGGGSGHSFKMGPAIGERLAAHIFDDVPPEPTFSLARLTSPPEGGWRAKWA